MGTDVTRKVTACPAMAIATATAAMALTCEVSPLWAGSWLREEPIVADEDGFGRAILQVVYQKYCNPRDSYFVEVHVERWYGGGWIPLHAFVHKGEAGGFILSDFSFNDDGTIKEANRHYSDQTTLPITITAFCNYR